MIYKQQIRWAFKNPFKFIRKYFYITIAAIKNPRSVTEQYWYLIVSNKLFLIREIIIGPIQYCNKYGFKKFIQKILFYFLRPKELYLTLQRSTRDLHLYVVDKSKKPYDGVNLFGFYEYTFGLSRTIHFFENICNILNIPYSINNIPVTGHKSNFVTYLKKQKYNSDYYINIVCINPDQCPFLFDLYPYELYFKDKYNIAYWMHETSLLPKSFHKYAQYFDEIWTPSNFSKSVLEYIDKPIYVIPLVEHLNSGLKIGQPLPIQIIYNFLKNKEENKKFLFIFDYLSCPFRKNIFQLIEIFKEVYKKTNGFILILKIKNVPANFVKDLQKQIGEMPIIIYEEDLSSQELTYLYTISNYYISLHASEGYGLTVLEAISYGLMPIVTNYGGVTDFCDESNSILIDYDLIDIPKESIYYGGGKWAKPKKQQVIDVILSLIKNKIILKPSLEIFNKLNKKESSNEILELLKNVPYKNV